METKFFNTKQEAQDAAIRQGFNLKVVVPSSTYTYLKKSTSPCNNIGMPLSDYAVIAKVGKKFALTVHK